MKQLTDEDIEMMKRFFCARTKYSFEDMAEFIREIRLHQGLGCACIVNKDFCPLHYEGL